MGQPHGADSFNASASSCWCTAVQRARSACALVVARVRSASPDITRLETRAAHTILHFPYKAITLSAVSHLHRHGGQQIRSVAAMCVAAPRRLAKQHVLVLQSLLQDVCSDTKRHGDIHLLTQGDVSPRAWKTIPIAEHLLGLVKGQDVALHPCNFGIAAARRNLAKQSADEQRQSAAIKVSSKLSQQFDNLDPQPAAMQQYT